MHYTYTRENIEMVDYNVVVVIATQCDYKDNCKKFLSISLGDINVLFGNVN